MRLVDPSGVVVQVGDEYGAELQAQGWKTPEAPEAHKADLPKKAVPAKR